MSKEKEIEMERYKEKQDKKGIYILVGLFVVSWLVILFGSPIYKLIGWVSLLLIAITSYHIYKKNKMEGNRENGK